MSSPWDMYLFRPHHWKSNHTPLREGVYKAIPPPPLLLLIWFWPVLGAMHAMYELDILFIVTWFVLSWLCQHTQLLSQNFNQHSNCSYLGIEDCLFSEFLVLLSTERLLLYFIVSQDSLWKVHDSCLEQNFPRLWEFKSHVFTSTDPSC